MTQTGIMLTTMLAPNGVSIAARITWTEADPYAVRFEFIAPGSGTETWEFARNLLIRKPLAEVPAQYDGDVAVTKTVNGTHLGLRSPMGDIVLLRFVNFLGVHEFISQSYAVVPEAMESDLILEELDSVIWEILETDEPDGV